MIVVSMLITLSKETLLQGLRQSTVTIQRVSDVLLLLVGAFLASAALLVAETGYKMVIDKACALHKSVAGRGAEEAKTSFFKIRAYFIPLFRAGGDVLHPAPFVPPRFAAHHAQKIIIETAELFLDRKKIFCVCNCRFYLAAVAHNARIFKKQGNLSFVVPRNFFRIKTTKGFAKIFSFIQDNCPA